MKKLSLITYDRTKASKKYNKLHRLVYNTRRWRDLSKRYLAQNPLCLKCKEAGIIKLADEVHHKVEISEGLLDAEIVRLGFDWDNLEGICKKHHHQEHNERRMLR